MGANPYRGPALGSETVQLLCVLDLSGSVFVKLNAFILHCHQPHPDSSRAVMEAAVPCSVATPSVAEQLRVQAALPAAYLTPTTRRSDKGDHRDTIHYKIVMSFSMANFLYGTCLQGIMVVVRVHHLVIGHLFS